MPKDEHRISLKLRFFLRKGRTRPIYFIKPQMAAHARLRIRTGAWREDRMLCFAKGKRAFKERNSISHSQTGRQHVMRLLNKPRTSKKTVQLILLFCHSQFYHLKLYSYFE